MPQHNQMAHAEVHEPKHITISGTVDTGKVITPSGSTAGASELRFLTADEVGALPEVGGQLTGPLDIDDADGLSVLGTIVVRAQQAAIPNQAAATITEVATPGSADTASVQTAIDNLTSKVNTLLAALRAHGLIQS